MIAPSTRTWFLVPADGVALLIKVPVFLVLALASAVPVFAQGDATVSRVGDLQIGGGFSIAQPDYGTSNLMGLNIYSTFDFRAWIGIEASFHHASAGDAVLMRPLVVHASPRAARPTRRRVIHLEYAALDVPAPLEWAFA